MKWYTNKKYLFVLLLSMFVVCSIVALMKPSVASWDGAVYVGMGKYLFSGGSIGVWEVFRPVLWPSILGAFWKIGMDPYSAGVALSILFSCTLLCLVYAIGEKMKPWVGLYAATIICFLPVFFQYSRIPMTDIVSTVCTLSSVWLLSKQHSSKHIFFAGIVIGFGFLFRFPQGLMLMAGTCIIVIENIFYTTNTIQEKTKNIVKHIFFLVVGYGVSTVLFFVLNMYLYGNAITPLIAGNNIVKNFPERYNQGFLFYFKTLFQQSAFVVFFVPVLSVLIKKQFNRTTLFVCITLAIYITYFLYQSHKEVRYMLAFIPYVFLLSSLGLVWCIEKVRYNTTRFDSAFLKRTLFFILLVIGLVSATYDIWMLPRDERVVREFSSFFAHTQSARILSTSPFPAMYGDVHIVRYLYDDWQYALESYSLYKDDIDYIALDSCVLEVACTKGDMDCIKGKDDLLGTLEAKEQRVYKKTSSQQCEMSIYKIVY